VTLMEPPSDPVSENSTPTNSLTIGVISDTHGFIDPQIEEIFSGVDHILHAGDIGWASVILELEHIAPVTAVTGNTDESNPQFKDTEIVELGGRRFLIHHQVDARSPGSKIKQRIIRENPDVVVFGHTHKKSLEMIGEALYLNPGYAGQPKPGLPRSVALLHCDDQGITVDFVELGGAPA
jgi:uncharacterized protein